MMGTQRDFILYQVNRTRILITTMIKAFSNTQPRIDKSISGSREKDMQVECETASAAVEWLDMY